jgi:hypothetical protein
VAQQSFSLTHLTADKSFVRARILPFVRKNDPPLTAKRLSRSLCSSPNAVKDHQMSGSVSAISKTWLNAKDNWLGEGPFRPAQYELMRLTKNIGLQTSPAHAVTAEQRDAAAAQACDIYFAHG